MAQYGSMTLREREDKNRLRKKNDERNQDTSSDASVRELKKAMRKLNPLPKKLDRGARLKYDEHGLDKDTGLDLCDCLIEECPGCWLQCRNCKSKKCGHECRQNRRYKYDTVEIEGTNLVIRNKKGK